MSIYTLPLALLIGWVIGNLLNYLADVLPRTRRLSSPACIYCDSSIGVNAYIKMKPCGNCNHKRSWRAWITLGLSALLTTIVWFFPPDRLWPWVAVLLFTYFGLIAIIDLEHRLILHPTSLVGALLCLPIGVIWLNNDGMIGAALTKTLLGGLGGAGIMLALYLLGIGFSRLISWIRHQPFEEEAIGFGDVFLSGVLGFLLGWPRIAVSLAFTILLAAVLGGIYLIIRSAMKKYEAFAPIPYAPFLLLAAIILVYMA